MSWLARMRGVVHFEPWYSFENDVDQVLADIQSLNEETRHFLNFYLPTHRPSSSTSTPSSLFSSSFVSPTSSPVPSSLSSSHSLSPTTSTSPSLCHSSCIENSPISSTFSTSTPPHTSSTPINSTVSILDSVEILFSALTTNDNTNTTDTTVHDVDTHTPSTSTAHTDQVQIRRDSVIPSELAYPYMPACDINPKRLLTVRPSMSIYTENHKYKLPCTSIYKVTHNEIFAQWTKTSCTFTVAQTFNDLFNSDVDIKESAMDIMSSAVSMALLTTTGYAAVTNGQHCFVIAVRSHCTASRRLNVLVSRGFDVSANGVYSLLACVMNSVKVKKKEDKGRLLRQAVLMIGNHTPKIKYSMVDERSSSKNEMTMNKMVTLHKGVVMYTHDYTVLKSHHVNNQNKTVYIKIWNELNVEGYYDMDNEITNIHFLANGEETKQLFGSCIPTIFTYTDLNHPSTTDVVPIIVFNMNVANYYSITKDCDTTFYVVNDSDSEDVSVITKDMENERSDLIKSIQHGLKLLHECNLSYEDIQFDNFRLSKQAQETSWKWKLWWINLAPIVPVGADKDERHKQELFAFEIDQVNYLFEV